MKNTHPYTGKWLREWFPEQTKSIPCILIWTVVFLADTAFIFWAADALGIHLMELPYRLTTVVAGLYLVLAFVLFWAETAVYNRILAHYRKTLE